MDKSLNIFEEQLKESHLDNLIDTALKDKRVLTEAFKPSMNLSRRDVQSFIEAPDANFTVSLNNMHSIYKISGAVYRVFLRSKISQCRKLKGTARQRCVNYNKIISWEKAIDKLHILKDGVNDKKINFRIKDIRGKIQRLKMQMRAR